MRCFVVREQPSVWNQISMFAQYIYLLLQLKNYKIVGLVMAVEATKVATFREQLRSLIDE